MSSMSDIGFLLLIFIMLISLINQRHEVPLDYPEAEILEKTQQTDNLEVWVERGGRVSVNGQAVDSQRLEELVVDTLRSEPGTRIHIIADRQAPYRHIDGVISILQRLQHRVVSFVVKESL